MVDKAFIIKIANTKNVNKALQSKIFTHEDIYNFEHDIKIGNLVFIVFGGDKSQIKWEQGLIGYGEISEEPYAKGYDPNKPRNFKINITPKKILEHPIPPKDTKIHPIYAKLFYEIPYVGANHFPNQAIAKFEGKKRIKALQSILISNKKETNVALCLPKPFILLSGISGTGKTRFVKEQAKRFREDGSNYCIVPVRPDWHEPSDLLGYISRLGSNGTEYIVTDFLQFIVSAWREITERVEDGEIHYKDNCIPYWLCLDEMNLAPVEQYFADYLSIIETRYWEEGEYHCDALLNSSIFKQVNDPTQLRTQLDLEEEEHNGLWEYFLEKGISIPPNLIVAGTVNMDETTHGFSRKVVDRAFTIDFGEFFPNDYQTYFEEQTQPKTLSFPIHSQVDLNLIADYDPGGSKSIEFLEAINSVLKETPFELAYRALNELLIAVVCFRPNEPLALQAVWDDFLMTKVLPRIEGDTDKLQENDEGSLINQLESILEIQLNEIWTEAASRPDLLREQIKGGTINISCRSKKKLSWMKARLSANGFTSFWP